MPDRQNLKQLKILAKDNQEFCYFIDQMCDRKSDLYNSYYDSQTEYLNEIRVYIKENRKQFKYKEDHIAIVDARFKYLFTYILEKFKEYTAT